MKHDNWLENLPRDTTGFVNHLIGSQVAMVQRKFETALRDRVKQELRRFEIEFTDEGDFNDFCINNVERVRYQDRPFYNELYLVDKINEKKHLLFVFSEKVDVDFSHMSNIKVTIGETIEVKKN